MTESRLFGQLLHSGVLFGLGFGSRLLLAIALGKSLSPTDYGVYSLIAGVVAMASGLLPLGSSNYTFREVPGATAVRGASILKSVSGVHAMILGALLLGALPLLGSARPVRDLFALDEHPGLCLLLGAILFADWLAYDLSRFLFARRQIEHGNVVVFLQTGLWGAAAFAAFAIGGLTLSGVFLLWAGSSFLAVAFGLWRADWRQLRGAPFDPQCYPAAVRFGFPLLSAYVVVGVDWVGRLLMASHYSTAVVGVYTYHQNVILMIAAISSPLIANPIDPYVMAAYSNGQPSRSGYLLGLALRSRLLLVMPLLVVTVTSGDTLIRLLAGGAYVASPWLFAILAPIPVLVILANTFERAIFLDRRTSVISRCQLVAAAVQGGLYLVLVPWHQLYGAALAMDAGFLVLTALLWPHLRRATVAVELALVRTALTTVPCVGIAWAVAHVAAGLPPIAALALAATIVGASFLLFACVFRMISEPETRKLRMLASGSGRRMRALLVRR
jgi:O-antigen/teichoic acid export membrane protein